MIEIGKYELSNFPHITLPKRVKIIDSKSFVTVDLDRMELQGDSGKFNLSLRTLSAGCQPHIAFFFQYVVLHALNGRRKVNTVVRWGNEFRNFSKHVNTEFGALIETISFKFFNSYTCTKNPSQQKLIRSFIQYWKKLGVSGIDADLQDYLAISKSPKARSTTEIQNSVQHERPFSVAEVRRILAAVDDLYIEGKFDPADNFLWRLIISEALRPSQMRLLLTSDICLNDESDDQSGRITLSVPIVKQSGTAARDLMFDALLSDSTSQALYQHLKTWNIPFESLLTNHFPLFSFSLTARINTTRVLLSKSIGDLGQHEFFTRRFKHTKLTHLAILGAPLEVLARAGYQTTTVSLRHYTNLTDEAFEQYEKLMTKSLNEVHSAFRGRVVELSEVSNPSVENIVLSPDLNDTLGSCSATPCEAFAPIACYGCPKFEAFTDGAHESVLNFLVDRQRLAPESAESTESTLRDAHIIAAVKEVINAIKEFKNK